MAPRASRNAAIPHAAFTATRISTILISCSPSRVRGRLAGTALHRTVFHRHDLSAREDHRRGRRRRWSLATRIRRTSGWRHRDRLRRDGRSELPYESHAGLHAHHVWALMPAYVRLSTSSVAAWVGDDSGVGNTDGLRRTDDDVDVRIQLLDRLLLHEQLGQ